MSVFSTLIIACTLSTLALSGDNGMRKGSDLIKKLDKSPPSADIYGETKDGAANEVDPCTLPYPMTGVDMGCLGLHTRFYYDVSSGQCMLFQWGGCYGNANNFKSLADCKAKCVVAEPTVLEPESAIEFYPNQVWPMNEDEATHEKEATNWFQNPYSDRTRRSTMKAQLEKVIESAEQDLIELDEMDEQESNGVAVKQVAGRQLGEACYSRWDCDSHCCTRCGGVSRGYCNRREVKAFGLITDCPCQ